VHDLQLVAVLKLRCIPVAAWHNLQIQLHRDAIRFHAQVRNQGRDCQAVREVTGFAVNVEEHENKLSALGSWLLALSF
jgi:hypothetical protein